MKNYLIKSMLAMFVFTLVSFNGCILDSFNSVTQNVPISQTFYLSSNQTSFSDSQTVDLSSSSVYQNYQEKIESIQLVRAEYRTISVNPSSLSGNISFVLNDWNGNKLFSLGLGQITPANYQKTPLEFQLTGAQIAMVNNYLSKLSNNKFQATISITNIKSSSVNYTLIGAVDAVFEMKSNL